jgi:opacity protein-like surface antigen
MKKIIFVIFSFLLVIPLFPVKKKFYTALGFGYQFKSDQYFKLVYDNGMVDYTADLGYWFGKHIASGIKVSYSGEKGETALLKSETRLKQIPVVGYVKAGLEIGKKWQGYVSLGMGYMFFKEESYIGTVKESQFGWEIESGIEFSFAKRFYFLGAARYQSFKKTFPEMNETHQLGGTDIRLGLGIRY